MHVTKLKLLKNAAERGDWETAVGIAARFAELGEHKEAITRGWAARGNRAFYVELGYDPDALWALAVAALCERYGLTPPAADRAEYGVD